MYYTVCPLCLQQHRTEQCHIINHTDKVTLKHPTFCCIYNHAFVFTDIVLGDFSLVSEQWIHVIECYNTLKNSLYVQSKGVAWVCVSLKGVAWVCVHMGVCCTVYTVKNDL